jgi:hypothetical protein
MVRAAFLMLVASCMPVFGDQPKDDWPKVIHADATLTRSGARTADFDTALIKSGADDLACPVASIFHSKVDLNARQASGGFRWRLGPISADVDAVDGCGKRAVYGKQCETDIEWVTRDVQKHTYICRPALISRVDL